MLFNRRNGIGLIESARENQYRIVGLIVVTIKGLQSLDRHVLDIRACADDGAAIVVPEISCCHDALT